MKAKELANMLLEHPESEVWCGAWNGYVETYAVVDHVFPMLYDQVSNDFFGTPGRMDKRLFEGGIKGRFGEEIVYIGSRFGRCPNPEVDFGDDNIDYPIKTLNGEDGDPDLVWNINHFVLVGDGIYKKSGEDGSWEITYNTKTDTLDIQNYRDQIKFTGKIIGIESLRNIVEACKVNLKIWT